MKCNYNQDGNCTLPIPVKCGDKCAYGELLEEFIALEQNYKACVNEYKQILKQNTKVYFLALTSYGS